MATNVSARWVDPDGYGFNSSEELEADKAVELTFELEDSTLQTVLLRGFKADEKAAAIAAFMTWLERIERAQTTKNKIGRLETQLEELLEPVA